MSDKKPSNSFVVIASAIGIMFLVGILILTVMRAVNLQSVLQLPKAYEPQEETAASCKKDAEAIYTSCKVSCGSAGVSQDCLNECGGSSAYCNNYCASTASVDCVSGCLGIRTKDLAICEQLPGGKKVEKSVGTGGMTGKVDSGDNDESKQNDNQKDTSGKAGSVDNNGSNQGGNQKGSSTAVTTGGQSCNAGSPADVWFCYQKGINGVGVGNCAWCWANRGGSGSGGNNGSSGGNASCFNSCFEATGGNGSGCRTVCDKAPSCYSQCVKDGKKPLNCIVPCANGTYATPTPKPGLSPTPTPEPISDEEVCQGNVDAPTNCFSCLKDKDGDQLNIYDFACFSSYYGETVGKN